MKASEFELATDAHPPSLAHQRWAGYGEASRQTQTFCPSDLLGQKQSPLRGKGWVRSIHLGVGE